MENLVCAPVLMPLATAIALLPLAPRLHRSVSLAGAAANLLAASLLLALTWDGKVLVLELGGWGARVGIVWVADGMSAAMLTAASFLCVSVFACIRAGWDVEAPPRTLHPLLHLLAMGVNGAISTGDFFNLFVFYEVMLLASFALVVTASGREVFPRTIPYILVNLAASALFLAAVGSMYGLTGTVNMAELARLLSARPPSAPLTFALGLMLAAFAIKAGLVPFFVWLPDAYPAAPLTLTALFAGLLTKAGVYTLFRATPLLFPAPGAVHEALIWGGTATMAVGVLGALGRSTVRGILSFHIVSQIGYMVFGLGLGTAAGLAAALLFTVHNMAVKPALILAGGVAERRGGTGELKSLGGLAGRPWAAAAFLVPALALAGLPPLSGFWGKLLLVRAGFEARAFVASAVAIVVSLLTLASMLKIWSAVYWSGHPGEPVPALSPPDRQLVASALALAAAATLLGLAIGPALAFAERAAAQVLAVQPYVAAVLGAGGSR